MAGLIRNLEAFIEAVTEALEIREAEPDPFTKFSLNLYFCRCVLTAKPNLCA